MSHLDQAKKWVESTTTSKTPHPSQVVQTALAVAQVEALIDIAESLRTIATIMRES